jgi:hypothetical protein
VEEKCLGFNTSEEERDLTVSFRRQTDRTSIAGVQSAVTGYTANPNKPTSITLPSISYLDSGKGI